MSLAQTASAGASASGGYGSTAIWFVIVVLAVATYAIRLSFIYLFGRLESVPEAVERVLRLVPAAVLAALALPAVVTLEPSLSATVLDERLAAGIVAVAVAWRTENVFATIASGMGTLWLLRFAPL
ncbi:AzlD domain-containing protein [Natronomonas sp.]|uniref:AzlD domain-containing protein n=1 Tax=Natronomonas sp. TaxID=2184060 RepID=UPI0039758AA0